jgi:hypothetical protein
MQIVNTIRTSLGPRQLPPRPMVRVSLTGPELDALIRKLNRDAVQAQHAGRSPKLIAWHCARPRCGMPCDEHK